MSVVKNTHNECCSHKALQTESCLTSAVEPIAFQTVADRACAVVAAYFIGAVVLTSTIGCQALVDVCRQVIKC